MHTAVSSVLGAIGNTPMVELARVGAGLPAKILAKCEHLNPGGSVKDRIALYIVEDAEARGLLRPGMTLVEATAGNTGLGLALVAAVKGYSLVCVLPEKMSEDKRSALRCAGARVIVVPNAPLDSPENFQAVAKRLARENQWFLTDQFASVANLRAHEETTGPEILAQCGGTIAAFVAGAGTGGTITGVAKYLKRACPSAKVLLADPAGSSLAQWVATGELGPDGSYAIEGIGSSKPTPLMDRALLDRAITVSDEEAFTMTQRLVREEGLFVGGSAGLGVAAAVRYVRETGCEGNVVVMLPDGWDRYRSKPWMSAWGAEK
ncbi:MAG: cysteine synthase family protein [Deltaproteobacteria bacterium]|nr:cysteine synthase family protein [Deltaproteobacteria bacterium]